MGKVPPPTSQTVSPATRFFQPLVEPVGFTVPGGSFHGDACVPAPELSDAVGLQKYSAAEATEKNPRTKIQDPNKIFFMGHSPSTADTFLLNLSGNFHRSLHSK